MPVNKATAPMPCPFCSCDVVRREHGYEEGSTVIVCCMCGAAGPANGDEDTAIALWNTRNYGIPPEIINSWGNWSRVMR